MTTVITNMTTPSHDKDFFLSKIVFGLAYVLPCRPATFKHDDQQLRHRHRYALRYGHDSPCLPSTDRSYENDSFILDRNCETRTLKETLKKEDKSKLCVFDDSKSD